MTTYHLGLVTGQPLLPSSLSEPLAELGNRVSAYRRGASDLLRGTRYLAHRGNVGVVASGKAANQAAQFIFTSVHVGLIIAGVVAVTR